MRISLYSNKIELFNNTLNKNNTLSKRDFKLLGNEIKDVNIIYRNENKMFEKMTKDLNFRKKLKKRTHGTGIIEDLIKVKLNNKFDPIDNRESLIKSVRDKKKKITMKIDVEKINNQLKEKFSQKELIHIKPELVKLTLNALESTTGLIFKHSTSSSSEDKEEANKEILSSIKNTTVKRNRTDTMNKSDDNFLHRSKFKQGPNTNFISSHNDILSTKEMSNKNNSSRKTKETINLKNLSTVKSFGSRTSTGNFFSSILKKNVPYEDSQLEATKSPEDNTLSTQSNSNVMLNNLRPRDNKKVFLRTSILLNKCPPVSNSEENETKRNNFANTRDSVLQTISELARVDSAEKKSLSVSPRKFSKAKEPNPNRRSVDIIVGQVQNLSPTKIKRQSHILGDHRIGADTRPSLITNPHALNNFLIRDFNIGETTDPVTSSKKKMEMTTKMFQLKEEKMQERIKTERDAYEKEKFGGKIKNNFDNAKDESFILDEQEDKLEEEKFEKIKKKLNKRKLRQCKDTSRRLVELIEEASKHNYFKTIKSHIPGSFINRQNLDRIILMRNILKHKVSIDDEQMEMSNMLKFKERMRENDNELLLMLNKMGPPSFLKGKFRQETVDKFLRVNGKFFGVYV